MDLFCARPFFTTELPPSHSEDRFPVVGYGGYAIEINIKVVLFKFCSIIVALLRLLFSFLFINLNLFQFCSKVLGCRNRGVRPPPPPAPCAVHRDEPLTPGWGLGCGGQGWGLAPLPCAWRRRTCCGPSPRCTAGTARAGPASRHRLHIRWRTGQD